MNDPLPCIICGTQLPSASPKDDGAVSNQPAGGTAFTTHGHYGSTFFDPMDDSFLEVTICDPCLRQAATRGRILLGTQQVVATPRPAYTSYPG